MNGMHPTRRQLAHKLKVLRFARGWSQESLAVASGLHRTYISNLERGHSNPSLDILERLARAFDTSPAELLRAPEPQDIVLQWQQWHCKESAGDYRPALALLH